MADYKEILRLQALGFSKQAIATSIGCSRNTVRSALAAAEANGVTWENSRGTGNEALRKKLYPGSAERPEYRYLNRDQILRLASCAYIREAHNVILLGRPGPGRRTCPTIFCSQFDVPGWHENLYDPTLADAICDRIVYDSYVIRIDGDTMRKRKGILTE